MNKIFSLVVIISGLALQTSAQIATSSPYSRFGLGDLHENILPEFSAFGGASTAFNNSSTVNPNNPASFTSFKPNSFLFSTGGWHKTTRMQNKTEEHTVNNNAFSHLIVGFPLSEKWGASIGMLPYSSVGYELNSVVVDENNPEHTGTAYYFGDGGISKIYFGGAYEPIENFSIGLKASYLFGGLNRRKQLVYDDESFMNSRGNSTINLKGYYYELGLLYKYDISEEKQLTIGLTANNDSKIRAKKSELVESFEYSGVFEIPKDTFVNNVAWGDVTLPQYISGGLTYSSGDKWLFVADYSMQNWADYSMLDESDNLANSTRISGGMQFTPDFNSITKYYKRMDYRLGGSYSNTPLLFDGNQLQEMSVSFGFGIPVKKSRTKYDFSCTIGKRGTTEGNLIKEQFVRLGLSVSYDGIWFVKRKYD
jgi:long-subunit fatty acid transport protein